MIADVFELILCIPQLSDMCDNRSLVVLCRTCTHLHAFSDAPPVLAIERWRTFHTSLLDNVHEDTDCSAQILKGFMRMLLPSAGMVYMFARYGPSSSPRADDIVNLWAKAASLRDVEQTEEEEERGDWAPGHPVAEFTFTVGEPIFPGGVVHHVV